jgi:hypothetical protein
MLMFNSFVKDFFENQLKECKNIQRNLLKSAKKHEINILRLEEHRISQHVLYLKGLYILNFKKMQSLRKSFIKLGF